MGVGAMAEATNPERPLKRMKAETKTPKTVMDSAVSPSSTDYIPPIDLWNFSNKIWERINGLIRSHFRRNHGDGLNLTMMNHYKALLGYSVQDNYWGEIAVTGDGAQVGAQVGPQVEPILGIKLN